MAIFKSIFIRFLIAVMFMSVFGVVQQYYSFRKLQIYKIKYNQAAEYCLENKNNKKRDNTTLIKGYKSFPCGKDLYVKKCKTCAYVTSSGHLAGSKRGKEIDSYDCVFRSNSAPIEKYKEDVGSKTTFRTIDHSSIHAMLKILETDGLEGFDLNAPNKTIFLGYHLTFNGEDSKLLNLLPEWPEMSFYRIENEKFQEFNDIYNKEIKSTTSMLWMSNGFISILLMEDFCEEINVYGIADKDYCQNVKNGKPGHVDVPYHYYGFLDHLETECWKFWRHANGYWGHYFVKEKELFYTWNREKKYLHFHQPEWES